MAGRATNLAANVLVLFGGFPKMSNAVKPAHYHRPSPRRSQQKSGLRKTKKNLGSAEVFYLTIQNKSGFSLLFWAFKVLSLHSKQK
jgi:hypothetical protein